MTDHTQYYPDPSIIDWEKKSDKWNHGEIGHIGYKCGPCARQSENMIAIVPSGVDYWQDLQLGWQEECDIVMTAFDNAVANHFPVHQPSNCTTCPPKPILPNKPEPPIDRAATKQD